MKFSTKFLGIRRDYRDDCDPILWAAWKAQKIHYTLGAFRILGVAGCVSTGPRKCATSESLTFPSTAHHFLIYEKMAMDHVNLTNATFCSISTVPKKQ